MKNVKNKIPIWTWWMLVFNALVIIFNPYTSIDIIIVLFSALVVSQVVLKEKVILVFLIARPLIDYWRDYYIISYKQINVNLNATVALTFILWGGYYLYKYRDSIKKLSIRWLAYIFIGISALSALYSYSLSTTAIELTKLVTLFLFFFLGYIFVKEKIITPKEIWLSIAVSALIPIVFAVFQLVAKAGLTTYDVRGRIFGTFAHPNVFAFFIMFLLFIFTQKADIEPDKFWQKNPGLKKFLYVLLTGLILFTYTRAALVGLVVFVLVVGVFKFRKLLIHFLLTVVVGYILIFPVGTWIYRHTDYDIQSIGIINRITQRNEDADSIEWRLSLVEGTTSLIRQKPVLGYGYGVFPLVWEQYRGSTHIWDDSSEAHNDYLRLALEVGLLGLITYLLFLAYLVVILGKYSLQKKTRDQYLYLFGAILAFSAVSLSDNMINHTPVMWMFWVVVGAQLAHKKII